MKRSSNLETGSSAWSGRVIFARDLEPVVTRLEATPHGPRLVLEADSFAAILPATPHILKLLAAKHERTVIA